MSGGRGDVSEQPGAAAGAAVRETAGAGLQLAGLSVGYRGGQGRGRRGAGRRGVRRSARVILRDLDLAAPPGAVTMVLGPNGSGKSTLLRTVACLQPALGGQVRVGGADLARMPPRARARLLAVVLTERFDPGLLTGGEVVALGRHPHLGASGSLAPADRTAIAEALAVMHAEDLATQRVAQMSDGQRQRILVARALAQQPRLLVLDEPSAFLDAPTRIELLEQLRVIAADRDIAVVLSTHDVETALRSGGRCWLIARGVAGSGPKGSGGMGGAGGTGVTVNDTASRIVISGPIERLAADGAIGAAFDTSAVHFRPASGTFRLR